MIQPAPKRWTVWRILCYLFVATLIITATFVGWQYWLFTGGIFRTSNFNEVEWKSLNQKTSDSSCYRGGMAHDIKTNVLRIGMTKPEVENLLGQPDAIEAETHEYFLGMCSGLRIDMDTLDVHFNSEGQLTKIQVVQH